MSTVSVLLLTLVIAGLCWCWRELTNIEREIANRQKAMEIKRRLGREEALRYYAKRFGNQKVKP